MRFLWITIFAALFLLACEQQNEQHEQKPLLQKKSQVNSFKVKCLADNSIYSSRVIIRFHQDVSSDEVYLYAQAHGLVDISEQDKALNTWEATLPKQYKTAPVGRTIREDLLKLAQNTQVLLILPIQVNDVNQEELQNELMVTLKESVYVEPGMVQHIATQLEEFGIYLISVAKVGRVCFEPHYLKVDEVVTFLKNHSLIEKVHLPSEGLENK